MVAPPPGARDIGDRGGGARRSEIATGGMCCRQSPPGMRPGIARRRREVPGRRLLAADSGRSGSAGLSRAQAQQRGKPTRQMHGDARSNSPRATAGTYERYIAGLAEIGQTPFLLRFNAFPEAHLDSLENPAYASGFPRPRGGFSFCRPSAGPGLMSRAALIAGGPAIDLQRLAAVFGLRACAGIGVRGGRQCSGIARGEQRARVGREYHGLLDEQLLVRLAGGGAPFRNWRAEQLRS